MFALLDSSNVAKLILSQYSDHALLRSCSFLFRNLIHRAADIPNDRYVHEQPLLYNCFCS